MFGEFLRELNSMTESQNYPQIMSKVKDKVPFAIIGSEDKDTKKDRFLDLNYLAQNYYTAHGGGGYIPLRGAYTYEGDDNKVTFEKSMVLPNISLEDAMEIGREVNQESIIYNSTDGFFGFVYLFRDNGVTTRGLEHTTKFNKRLDGYPKMVLDPNETSLYGSTVVGTRGTVPQDKTSSEPFKAKAKRVADDINNFDLGKAQKSPKTRSWAFDVDWESESNDFTEGIKERNSIVFYEHLRDVKSHTKEFYEIPLFRLWL